MARTSPVEGLVTRAAPLPTLRCWRLSIWAEREAWAACWRSRSRLVVTLKPPRLTLSSPCCSTRRSLIQRTKWGALMVVLGRSKSRDWAAAWSVCWGVMKPSCCMRLRTCFWRDWASSG